MSVAPEIPVMPSFTLKGKDGAEHTYELSPHPASEGDSIAWRLSAWGAGPLTEGLKAVAGAPAVQRLGRLMQGTEEMEEDEDALGEALGGILEALSTLDVGPFSIAVERVLEKLADNPKLVRSLFKYTTRDGKSMADLASYAQAYQDNYGELQMAAFRIIQANDFFPVARLFGGLQS